MHANDTSLPLTLAHSPLHTSTRFSPQGYKVFREVLLRCLTERKKCSIDKVIHDLLNAEDVMTAAHRAGLATATGTKTQIQMKCTEQGGAVYFFFLSFLVFPASCEMSE